MLKTWTKILLKGSLILVIATGVILIMSKITRPIDYESKDSTHIKVEGFYALEKNTVDVLFMGSSHAYYAFNPSILWEETNLTSYAFAGQCQPIEITYQYLLEALKTQNPQLIVLDLFALSQESDKCQTPGTYRVNIQDMKIGKNKVNAYQLIEDTNVIEEVLDVSYYHDRITELRIRDIEDSLKVNGDANFGYTIAYPGTVIWEREPIEVVESTKPKDRKWNALLNIIALCKEKDIELILTKTPYYLNSNDAEIYNYVWNYAKDNSIKVLDYSTMFKDIGYSFDLDGDSWHANAKGALKLTGQLSSVIKENYNFTPSKNDYEDDYKLLYAKSAHAIISRETNLNELKKSIDALNVTVIIQQNGFDFNLLNDQEKQICEELGLDFSRDMQLLRYSNQESTNASGEVLKYEINDHEIMIDSGGTIYIDNKIYFKGEANLNIIIFDDKTGFLLDYIGISKYDKLYMNRK